MLLSIIIVSYNTQKLTLEAVQAVTKSLESSSTLKMATEIIIVDNDSHDQSVDLLKQLKKELTVPLIIIENHKNVGFAAANNQAIKIGHGSFFLFLNSDTVIQNHALDQLMATWLETPDNQRTAGLSSHAGELDHLGILAATLVNADGSPQTQGGSFPSLLTLAVHMLLLDDLPLIGKWLPSTQHTGKSQSQSKITGKLRQQDWVGATAMMVKKEVFAEIGTLDEKIFMYGEDVEFCMRAKAHHWDIAVHRQAVITHLGSASSSSENAILGELKGYVYIWTKHKPFWQLTIIKSLIKVGCLLRMVIFGTILGNATKASIYLRAWESI